MASEVRLHHEDTDPDHDSGHSAQDVSDYAEAPAVGHGWPLRHSCFEHWPPRRFRSSPNLHDRLILFQVDFGPHFHVCLKCFLHLAAYKRDATRARAQEQEQALRKDYGDWGACTRCRAGPRRKTTKVRTHIYAPSALH